MMAVHGALYMWEWGLEKAYPIILTKSYTILRNWTGIFALLLAALIGITSFIIIRRKKYESLHEFLAICLRVCVCRFTPFRYELFYWTHFLAIFFIIAAVIHEYVTHFDRFI